MVNSSSASANDKALKVNLDPTKYGTFAEIGAGQETANNFFYAGASAGTIAKTISAYDMTMSDAIYGRTTRYVSRGRLKHMLDHEYEILIRRLAPKRGEDTCFFSYANTVRARGYKDTGECHGWMGIRLQLRPNGPPNDIVLHVRMLDHTNIQQQHALGIVGVNLIHAALFYDGDLESFVVSLFDFLTTDRIEIDMLKFEGADFADIDNRLCSLLLVQHGLAQAAMFSATGEVLQPAECFYKRPLVVLRGDFQPPSVVHLDMLKQSSERMREGVDEDKRDQVVEITEITMHNLLRSGNVDHRDFISRADMLQAIGKNVLISKFAEFHRLAGYLSRYTDQPIGVLVGLPLFEELFDERWYEGLDGGILEGFGRLFKHRVKLHVYPTKETCDSSVRRIDSVHVPDHLEHLFQYILTNGLVEELNSGVEEDLHVTPGDIRRMILAGDQNWVKYVPAELPDRLMCSVK